MLAAAALLGVACGADPGAGEARITLRGVTSVVEMVGPGGEAVPVRSGQVVEAGERLRVTAGRALLEPAGGGSIELRAGSDVRISSPTELLAGDAVVTAGDEPLTVVSTGTEAEVRGVARVGRSLA
ncbi:MAG: hypothetical protein ACRD0D_13995, partial [Acidimicrobiales bacterium]